MRTIFAVDLLCIADAGAEFPLQGGRGYSHFEIALFALRMQTNEDAARRPTPSLGRDQGTWKVAARRMSVPLMSQVRSGGIHTGGS
jgi:hypothetical protein